MKKFLVAAVMLAACVCQAVADDKDEAKARADAAIAVAKAKAKSPKIVAMTKPIPYAEGVKVAKSEHKPLIVSVGMHCEALCKELRPQFVTCHEATFEGSTAPRIILLLHAPDGTLFKMFVWPKLPTATEVQAKAAEAAKKLEPQLGLIEAAIAEMFCLDFEPSSCPNCAPGMVCVGNTCVPANQAVPQPYAQAGYQWMPVGDGPVTVFAAHPVAEHVRGRFQAFRHRVRCAVGLEPRQLGTQTRLPAAVEAVQPAVSGVVGGPLGNLVERAGIHRQLHAALKNATLTPAQQLIVAEVLADADNYAGACRIAHTMVANGPVPAGVVGKLGDGTLFKLLVQSLPQLLQAFEQFLKLIHGG